MDAPHTEYYRKPSCDLPHDHASDRRGVTGRAVIEAAKEAVSVPALAESLSGTGVRRGKEVFFRCPLHDDHDPSLRVDPAKNLWFCDPCGVGGDVVRFAQHAWKIEHAASAAAELLHFFGHPLPERPPSWFRKQERQQAVRDAIAQAKVDHLRRRLYRLFFKPSVVLIEDPDEREEERRILWEKTGYLARLLMRDLGDEGRSR